MESFGNLTINQLLEKMPVSELNLLRMVVSAKLQNNTEQVATVVPQKTEQVPQKTEQVPQKTEQVPQKTEKVATVVPQKTEQVHQKTEQVPQKIHKVKNFQFPKGTFIGTNKCLYCEDQVQRVMVGSFTTAKGFDEPIHSFNKDGSLHCHQAGQFFRNKRCFECEKRVFGQVLQKTDWRVKDKCVGTIGIQAGNFEGIPTRFIEMTTPYDKGYDIKDHGECTH